MRDNIVTRLQEARKLFEAGKPQEACELLFGNAKLVQLPELELVEGDGEDMRFGDWEMYWEEKKGCEMAKMRHFYALADHLTPEQLKSIRKDSRGSIFCEELRYDGKMVSVDGGAMVKCPVYNCVFLAKVLSTPAGLAFFQALCGTEDGPEAILKKFVKLSGMKRGDITVSTPDMDSRRKHPSRAVTFLGFDHELRIDVDSNYDPQGSSRGVRRRRKAR